MPTDKQRATHLLQHYLKFGLEAAGYRWDGDNQSEVAEIVDSIIAACTPAGSPSPSSATPSTQSTPSTPADPDMIQQAGELLRLFQLGMPLSDGTHGQDDSAIVQASATLAVAAEIRELRNVLAMAMEDGTTYNNEPMHVLRIAMLK